MTNKSTIRQTLVACIAIAFLGSCTQEKYLPQPLETIIKEDMEDGKLRDVKKAYFDLLHSAAPGVDWQEEEKKTALAKFETRQAAKNSIDFRDGEVSIAGDLLTGKWLERGSNNNAGSVIATVFDQETDQLYCIAGGGSLFRGGIDGNSWTVINQDIKFQPNFLVLLKDTLNTKRLVSAIYNLPHYSEDLGNTWTPCEGFDNSTSGRVLSPIYVEETAELFCLYKKSDNEFWHLYRSVDFGLSFEPVHNFKTSFDRNVFLTKMHHSADVFAIEQINTTKTKLHQWNVDSTRLEQLNLESTVGFGGQGRANLIATPQDEGLKFIVYDGDNVVKQSLDTGKTWITLDTLPAEPWEVGMRISKHDPNHLQIGAVNCYRSYDGGDNWYLINGWGQYYNDIETKLHADIMYLDEWTTSDGKPFVLNTNHGGMYVSYDNGLLYKNIGLKDLNVSQYYSVRTSPAIPIYVFAGSQDQGFQRGLLDPTIEGTVDLDQIISGDYGHITFTNYGESMWTVYPGGWISFYRNAISGGIASDYTIESDNESVWIPPIVADPDYTKNIVYAAGGSIDGGYGSYIIKLEVTSNNEMLVDQLPYNFKDGGGEIAAIGINPFDTNRWLVTTTNRKYYLSNDGGQSFSKINFSVPGSQYLYGAHITFSTKTEGLVFVSGSGYGNPAVIMSEDGGNTFANISSGLPPTTVLDFAISEDEQYLYAATEAGPYVYIRSEGLWYDMSDGIAPAQTYWSVEAVPNSNIARFGTYGRGIWDFVPNAVVPSSSVAIAQTDLDITLYPNPTSNTVAISSEIESTFAVTIYAPNGQIVYTNSAIKNDFAIDIQNLQQGQYILQAKTENSIFTKQFVKQ